MFAALTEVGVPRMPPRRDLRSRRRPPERRGWLAIREDLGDCRRCRLADTRKTIVFGQGNPKAELMFVGEAPGADEDEQGLAFVGRAGQLLTDIIEKGLKIPRADVFIANVLQCRPPGNRNPEPDEILACQPFLERKIEEIRPRVLVGLGKFAGAVAPEDRGADLEDPRAGRRLQRHQGRADVPPRVPPPQPRGQEGRVGGHEAGQDAARGVTPSHTLPTPRARPKSPLDSSQDE